MLRRWLAERANSSFHDSAALSTKEIYKIIFAKLPNDLYFRLKMSKYYYKSKSINNIRIPTKWSKAVRN